MASYQQFSSAGTIMQKIEELREWQRQQQQKLLQQQEEQRVLLSNEQQRIFKEFGLPETVDKGFATENLIASPYTNTGTSPVGRWLETLSNRSLDETQDSVSACDVSRPLCNNQDSPVTQDFYKGHSSIGERRNEISPIRSILMKGGRTLNLDDTPVNTGKKNFHELLQEKLEQLGGGVNTENNHCAQQNSNSKPKRPFLKKGEGIARFHMKALPQKQKTNTTGNTKKSISTNHLTSNSTKIVQTRKNKNFKLKQSKENAVKCSMKSAEISKSQYPKTPVSKLTLRKDESSPKVATWAHVLQQQNQIYKKAQVQEKHVISQEENSDYNSKDSLELSLLEKIREADKKSKKEVEELKIFEFLEQHAANSSFCSTSSLIARLMEGSINSTPVKNYQNVNQVLHSKNSDFSQQLVSNNTCFANKNSIAGYLPFGLDTEEGGESVQNAAIPTGAYVNSIKLAVESDCNEKNRDEGSSALNDRNLHVRFSETNEYKSVSDASFSSQDDSARNSDYNPRLAQTKNGKRFQDDQAWSDCSCTSSTSPNTSLNTSNISAICQSPEPRSPPNQQYDMYGAMTSANRRFPLSLDKNSYGILNHCVTNNPKVEKMTKVDVGVNTQNNSSIDLVQKNSLLNTRLGELEAEIEIFRRENTRLHKLKKEHEQEVLKYSKEKKEFEKNMKAEKEKMESALLEEKKKLQKEKLVFERYCKDLKDQPTKQEREEIQDLKQQLKKLQEELHKKDSRWSAANIRTKDRMKVLEQENAEFKKEVDKLKKERSQQKMVKPRVRSTSATRVIHTINDHITRLKPNDLENSIFVQDVVPTKKIPSSVLQQQKFFSQNHAKSKRSVSHKASEWGTTYNKTFQAIPDLKPESTEVDILHIPEETIPQSIVTNHRSRHNSSHSNKSNEIISIHPPSENVSYTSAEDDDDGDCDDAYSKRNDVKLCDVKLNDRINNLALYNALYYATQLECNAGAPENCLITNFVKADSSRMSSSNGNNSSHSIGNKESDITVAENKDVINFNEMGNSEVREIIPVNESIKSRPSSAAVSLNSDIISFTKNISSDVGGLVPKGSKPIPSSTSVSQNSEVVTFTTADSSRTHISVPDDSMPSANKNSEYVTSHDEFYIRDTRNQTSPYNDIRKQAFETESTSHQPSSFSMQNEATPGTGDSSQYSSFSPSLTSQNGNSSIVSKSGNREKIYPDGRKEIWYPNGNLKKISADGLVTKVIYYNGDVKETLKDGTVKYFYAETKTWHTTYVDGSEILEFPNGHMETRQKDGTKEVTYPNATVRTCYPDGREEWVFQDGLMVKVDTKIGEKVLLLPNGQREVHTTDHMRREYPDGTVKILYPDGIQETRYSNGRIRVKDREGKLIMDSIMQRL